MELLSGARSPLPSLTHGLQAPAVFAPCASFRAAQFCSASPGVSSSNTTGPGTSTAHFRSQPLLSALSPHHLRPSVGPAAVLPSRARQAVVAVAAAAAAVESEQPLEELPEKLQKIVRSFQAVPDPRARYQQLLFYASRLPPLPKDLQTPEHKVVGCVSQVWVVPRLDSGDGCMYFRADSDSQLTKGLAALLVEGLSGASPEAILRITPSFITQLGLRQSLTPSRNNGFLNMLRLMQKHALSAASSAPPTPAPSESVPAASPPPPAPATPPASPPPPMESSPASSATAPGPSGSQGPGGSGSAPRSRADIIRQKLGDLLSPVKLEVEDVSHQHAGHAGAREAAAAAAAAGKASHVGETHFNVMVVSSAFDGLSMVKRHRMIYQALDEEFRDGLHALSLVTKSAAEWGSI